VRTVALPYECEDPACGCHDPDHESTGLRVGFRREGADTFRAHVHRDGMLIDALRNHDLTELLRDVHRAYPRAHTSGGQGTNTTEQRREDHL